MSRGKLEAAFQEQLGAIDWVELGQKIDEMPVPEKQPGGRHRSYIDLELVERAASLGCTREEIAVVLGIGRATLFQRMQQEPEIIEAIERGLSVGRTRLRRLQWRGAEDGNPVMLIWLGKQLLGQKEKAELSGSDDAPLKIMVELVGERLEAPTIDHEPEGQPVFPARSNVEFIG